VNTTLKPICSVFNIPLVVLPRSRFVHHHGFDDSTQKAKPFRTVGIVVLSVCTIIAEPIISGSDKEALFKSTLPQKGGIFQTPRKPRRFLEILNGETPPGTPRSLKDNFFPQKEGRNFKISES